MGFYCRGCENLFHENQELRAKLENPWTAVEDGLPKVGVAVFVWRMGKSLFPTVGYRQRKSKYNLPWKIGGLWDKEVTHWMPIPAAPGVKT